MVHTKKNQEHLFPKTIPGGFFNSTFSVPLVETVLNGLKRKHFLARETTSVES